ncbi:pyridoxamine 5'-phosphate oxidase family protein [Cohnella sp. LGH]|uniref:MSMEG_1061 family FMN-dependent PPOX-type flavoprotein n=1 Tax=Cohnella sp. LGH TaxID=1619153 RepID=UPI001ADAEEBF|nr:MSMEG_1061 family FMN-dependent PPOX-type flavoprotein [Cohnella sp. LGH]QTH43873.1 pyridoxamine 5'-phosphate oxidase family protein [Cohnella sp. LGH]
MTDFLDIVSSEEEIRKMIGYSSELVNNKSINYLDIHCKEFISLSPMIFISTSDNNGLCDVSPRGDAPGFVQILDDKRLVIPERPGNRRIDSMRNILKNPKIGLIFIIPGLEETLRVNGEARIIKNEDILNMMKVNEKPPLLGIGVVVEECYMHCAKAFKRSRLWDHDSWIEKPKLPNPALIISKHASKLGKTEEEVSEALEESYTKRLY